MAGTFASFSWIRCLGVLPVLTVIPAQFHAKSTLTLEIPTEVRTFTQDFALAP